MNGYWNFLLKYQQRVNTQGKEVKICVSKAKKKYYYEVTKVLDLDMENQDSNS